MSPRTPVSALPMPRHGLSIHRSTEQRDEARASHDKLWPELVALRRGAVSK